MMTKLPFVYILFTFILTLVLLVVNYCVSTTNLLIISGDNEKVSPYECGFEPLGDARQKFDISFYLIAILFIIFDLEVVFILPLATVLQEVNLLGFTFGIIFLIILTIGFIYEFISGAITSVGCPSEGPPPTGDPKGH